MFTPFGSWKSPITADLIVAETIGINSIIWDGEDIYWLESRPAEAGRNVLVRRTKNGEIADITPPPFNVRTRVHEYGGGAFLVADKAVYFVNFSDQRLYRQIDSGTPQPLTAELSRRYADFSLDKSRHRLISVIEDHSDPQQEPVNAIASINLETGEQQILASGCDFYSSPRLSPDGCQLAWLSWNHPNMPWDESQLWVAQIAADGSLKNARCVAGGPGESVGEPKWSTDGRLYFSSDSSGWWNLYRSSQTGEIEPLWKMKAEFAYPHWIFGISTYDFADGQRLLCTYTQNGRWYLASLDLQSKQLYTLNLPYTNISSLKVQGNNAVFLGASPSQATCAVQLHLESGETTILKRSSDWEIPLGYLSIPEAIAFPTDGGLTAYAWYYPPQNQDYNSPAGELPPLLVKSHGGPTAATSDSLNLRVQYWTSRGFAYLDVNYGGSTGYGRQYRQRLEGQWGIVDVRDCINGAKYLVAQGKVDGDRLAISGGSAGGYTTLMALTFDDTFQAGASYYGVSDLAALAADTHKFESRYLERLVGPYPEALAVYRARSPIYHADQLSCPIIFFQGLEDRVVPPEQTEMMVAALKAKGLPVAYVAFEGEQHGFRKAENIKRALEGEFYFYSRIFGFEPAEAIAAITIIEGLLAN